MVSASLKLPSDRGQLRAASTLKSAQVENPLKAAPQVRLLRFEHKVMATRTIVCWALLLSAQSVSADPGAFRGPYLNNVTTDAITVVWESPTDTTGTVHYGIASVSEHQAQSNTASKHHEVRLTGLSGLAAPGSSFVYELEVNGTRYPGSLV